MLFARHGASGQGRSAKGSRFDTTSSTAPTTSRGRSSIRSVHEYEAGSTPNPCVRCNAFVKWPSLLETASSLDCSYVATGHYARIRREGDRAQILRGTDRGKDQSYALYSLPQTALERTLFPLGSMTKESVRTIAEKASLPTSGTEESQDICFIPEGDYRNFLARRMWMLPGPIQDTEGHVLGTHQGLPSYTIGQRKGLGIPAGRPLYVIEKDTDENLLVVGPREALCRRAFLVAGVNWVSVPPPAAGTLLEVELEVRYRTRPLPARTPSAERRHGSRRPPRPRPGNRTRPVRRLVPGRRAPGRRRSFSTVVATRDRGSSQLSGRGRARERAGGCGWDLIPDT